MQISSIGYKAVETLVRLAVQPDDKPFAVKDLARWINRSVFYTEGLLVRLRDANLVLPHRGSDPAYVLARPAHRITVAEIFEALDQPSDLLDRPLNASTLEMTDINDLQGTDLLWEALKGYVMLFLNGVSLADLAPATASLIDDEAGGINAIHAVNMQSTAQH